MKILNKKDLQKIAINHSADINYKDFMNNYRKCAAEPYYFLKLILYYQLIIHYVLEKIFYINYKNDIN